MKNAKEWQLIRCTGQKSPLGTRPTYRPQHRNRTCHLLVRMTALICQQPGGGFHWQSPSRVSIRFIVWRESNGQRQWAKRVQAVLPPASSHRPAANKYTNQCAYVSIYIYIYISYNGFLQRRMHTCFDRKTRFRQNAERLCCADRLMLDIHVSVLPSTFRPFAASTLLPCCKTYALPLIARLTDPHHALTSRATARTHLAKYHSARNAIKTPLRHVSADTGERAIVTSSLGC